MSKISNWLNISDVKKNTSVFVRHSDKYKEYLDKALKTKDVRNNESCKIQIHKNVEINHPFFIKVKTLGFGAYSSVNLMSEDKTKTLYAMKVITRSKVAKNRQLLEQQIKIHFRLRHPNIVELYHVYIQDGELRMIMEYLQQTLSTYLKKKQKITEKQASVIIKQVLEALDYLHKNGITHRDIKLENLLISNSVVKLCDFGLASHNTIFSSKDFVGTLDYLSPQIIQNQTYSSKSDIWAVGVLLYQLIYGKGIMSSNMLQSEKYRYLSEIFRKNGSQITYQGCSNELKSFFKKIFTQDKYRYTAKQLLTEEYIMKYDEGVINRL